MVTTASYDSRDASMCVEARRGDAEERYTRVCAISARYAQRRRRKSRFVVNGKTRLKLFYNYVPRVRM